MIFHILTLFPDIFQGFIENSIPSRAVRKRAVEFNIVNIRDYSCEKHRNCDDYPFGGGVGMVLKPEPIMNALEQLDVAGKRVVYPTPAGKVFNQAYAEQFSGCSELVIICGRYEGIDQRVIDTCVTDEISIGDYILSGGEIAAMVMIDAVIRLISGVINADSLHEESFTQNLLEYPQYTRPAEYKGLRVPEVLLSGHHEKIAKWRFRKRIEKTRENRPDLLEAVSLPAAVKEILKELPNRGDNHGLDSKC